MAERKQVLVIKHGALGDVVQGFDAYASLRAGLPDAHIAVLTSPAFAGFMQMMPWFDEVLIDPRPPLFDVPATLRVRSLLRRGWDAIIDLQCSGRTARYHRFLRSRGGVGLERQRGQVTPIRISRQSTIIIACSPLSGWQVAGHCRLRR